MPRGNLLTPESWQRRHRAIVALLWLHVAALPWLGISTGHGLSHSLIETFIVAAFAAGASTRLLGNGLRSVLATIGLISCSAILTHFFGGLIEMHFHFFVMVAVVTLYQSWLPFAFAIGYVLVHHGLVGVIDPESVYNHPDALAHPWRWASIHALFIAGESLACITAWRLNEISLEAERSANETSEKAYKDLAEAQHLAHIGSWDWNLDSNAVWWSEELYRICGTRPGHFIPTVESFMELVHPDDRHQLTALLSRILDGAKTMDIDIRVVRPDGAVRNVHCIGTARANEAGACRRMVGTLQDTTRQKELEHEIQHKAFHDPLTDLANRGLFLDRLTHALERRHPRKPVAVVFLDLDDFKSINDSLGHGVGDELLVRMAQVLESLVRTSDTVARFGGDEFAILVEDGEEATAVYVANRILEALQTPLTIGADEISVRVSIGIAIEEEGRTAHDLLRDADIAMYSVKTKDKNGFEICNSQMSSEVLRRLELKTELKTAVERQEFVLHFQPILALDTKQIVAVEALVRWNHPHWGMVPPNDFIPLAEESGLIVPLGTWVLQEAARQAKSLHAAAGRRFSISVNLSARQLYESDIVEIVKEALSRSGLEPSDLILEITETVLMDNRESAMHTLAALRSLGVQIAIDDFGTGYSSLSYLHQFPFDILKIDRAFVAGVADGVEEAALAQAVIKLAKVLEVRPVAEGIESEHQLDKLSEFGCRTGQGYFFSRPLPVPELRGWLARHVHEEPSDLGAVRTAR